jgi:protein subunit release factor A
LQLEVSSLVARTREPTFWDAADDARVVMSRIYALEQLLDRVDRLRQRAAGLVDLAAHARRTGDRSRIAEIFEAVDEIDAAYELARLELAGASIGATDGAVRVRVTAIGAAADVWAADLAAMYVAWAKRTARDATLATDECTVAIAGPATRELLLAEAGIHRRRFPDRSEVDARVSIDGATDDRIVRVYEEGRRTIVRDPRTNVRETSLEDVVREGRIDAFLLAAVRASDRGAPA